MAKNTQPKIILGIEASCDETSATIVQKDENGVKILSNIIASSASLQAKYGGVIPEQAAREQLKSIIPVIETAINDSRLMIKDIDAIAVTQGPGLIGSLLVGVETAKVLAEVWQKPLVPVNHLLGHFYANWINTSKSGIPTHRHTDTPKFPCLGLLISGGHTDLVLFKDHGKYEYLGGTRDDAAGECFDKSARLLGLPYPGGPVISKLASQGNPQAFKLPRPMLDSGDFDFSFSGLKTAVANLVNSRGVAASGLPAGKAGAPHQVPAVSETSEDIDGAASRQDPEQLADLCASIEEAIVDVLVKKTIAAAKTYNIEQIIVAGGVAANQKLAKRIVLAAQKEISRARVFIPPPNLCTDNAAYIATAAFYNFHPVNPLNLQADPNLSLSI